MTFDVTTQPAAHSDLNQEQFIMSNSADTGAPTAATIAAAGITYPPIDELLTKTSSKYGLSIYAAKRARQINDYYAQLGEGLLEYVGPLVEPLPKEKPLSIALREINAGLLTHTEGE
jgi:DNA-directed RNA polymerase subunit omega